jgi:hypothetical protein
VSKSTSRSSRRAASTRATRGRSKSGSKRRVKRVVRIKPLRAQVAASLKGLRKAEPNDAVTQTIKRLEQCLEQLNLICGPRPGGCGPDMAFQI